MMTTLVLNYSTSLFEATLSFFQNIANALLLARQIQANHYAAKMLSDTEYKGKEYYRILSEMNEASRKHYGVK